MAKDIDWKLGYEVRGRTIDAMEETIEELLQEIAILKAPLVQAQMGRWQPVGDGFIYHHTENIPAEWNYPAHVESIEFLEVRDNGAVIACGSMPKEDEHTANLTDNMRLCLWIG